MKKKMIATLLTGAMALSMVAGAATVMADDTTEAKDKYTIGFSPYTLTNEYFTAVLDGVQKRQIIVKLPHPVFMKSVINVGRIE